MNTFPKTISSVEIPSVRKYPSYTGFWDMMEFNRFGIITFVFGLIGCMGGVAVGFASSSNMIWLTVIIVPTVLTLAITLAITSIRFILLSAAISILADISAFIF